jgi:predicted nucleotidyltransferase
MLAVEPVQRTIEQITQRLQVISARIILFGSMAYGEPSDDSDIDLSSKRRPSHRSNVGPVCAAWSLIRAAGFPFHCSR